MDFSRLLMRQPVPRRACICYSAKQRGLARALRRSQFSNEQRDFLLALTDGSLSQTEIVMETVHEHYCLSHTRFSLTQDQVNLVDITGWCAAAVARRATLAEQCEVRAAWREWHNASRPGYESRRWMLPIEGYHRDEGWLMFAAGWSAENLRARMAAKEPLPSREETVTTARDRGVLLPADVDSPARVKVVRAVAPETSENSLPRYALLLADE